MDIENKNKSRTELDPSRYNKKSLNTHALVGVSVLEQNKLTESNFNKKYQSQPLLQLTAQLSPHRISSPFPTPFSYLMFNI